MVYAIISDVHANLIALSCVLKDARSCGAGKILCLGDVVGYGPEPEPVATMIRTHAALTLAGNHDDAVSGRLDAADFIGIAADAVARHREALSKDNLEWLKSLRHVYSGKSFSCAHGDFTSPESFEYVSCESEAAANFAATKAQLMFVGHSHVPGIFITGASGKVYSLPPTDFTLEDGKRYIVNPGSVGYPRTDGSICESTYILYDDAERTITFRRIPFTVRSVMQTGRNPKRIKKRFIAAIAVAAAIVAAAAAWIIAQKEQPQKAPQAAIDATAQITKVHTVKMPAAIKADRRENIILFSTDRKVAVEVKLAKGSPAAHLQLSFKDDKGKVLREERWTAKKSRKATVPVPKGATKAELSADRTGGDKPCSFDIFKLGVK
jgi:predicted phosphodiesterase